MSDTICALATPVGEGGIAIVRVSGEMAEEILYKVFVPDNGRLPLEERRLTLGTAADADSVMAVMMRAPHSYTGEDVAEIQAHGGVAVCRRIMQALLDAGARTAEPGEFTKRAFLNGKMDLTEAEAVQALIAAQTASAARTAYGVLRGRLFDEAEKLCDRLTDITAALEALIDYPEEDIDQSVMLSLGSEMNEIRQKIEQLLEGERSARILNQGLRVVLVGQPNVGKSSLLNMMAGTERAIVTEEAGTTRDTLDITVDCCGIPVILTDTAGLRDAEGKAEAIGIERAIKAVEAADLILAVREAGTAFEAELLERIDGRNVIFIANKTDIATEEPDGQTVYVSARTGEGAEELRRRIYETASVLPCEDVLITHQRQADCLRRAHTALCYAIDGADNGADADCISIDLRDASAALGELTGRNTSEDMIDRIFEKFCLGK